MHFTLKGPRRFGYIFLEGYGSVRFFASNHTFCPRVKGLKPELMRCIILSAAILWEAMASFLILSKFLILCSVDSMVVVSIILGIPGGLFPMMISYGVFCRSE